MVRVGSILLFVSMLCACAEQTPADEVSSTDQTDAVIEQEPDSTLYLSTSQFYQFTPKDERKKDPKIDQLLKTVERAIVKKDLQLLFSVMDENICSSYGGLEYGWEGFMSAWGDRLDAMWKKLDRTIKLGGFYESDTTFRLPYCDEFDRFPKNNEDPFSIGVATNKNTFMYPSETCEKGKGVKIGYAVARIDLDYGFSGKKDGVIKINPVGTGLHGFVKETDFYRSSDYSLIIEKSAQGAWRITAFAPYD